MKESLFPAMGIDWGGFLHSSGNPSLVLLRPSIEGRTILVTGAGGHIGSGLAKAVVALGAQRVLLLECSEQNLFEIDRALVAPLPIHIPILGDAGDQALLEEIFGAFHPEIVFHTAAFKHVALGEQHPLAVVRNNTIATWTLAQVAARYRSEKLVLISTDKAADPASIMGASKRVAELALGALDGKTRMISMRLGNVLGSPGSVVPIFLDQISRGGPLTISHPRASRYFLTREQAVGFIIQAAAHVGAARLLAPRLRSQRTIVDLAKFLIRQHGRARSRPIRLDFTGLRPGEKLTERLVSRDQKRRSCRDCGLDAIAGPPLSTRDLRLLMGRLIRSVERRNLTALLHALQDSLPKFTPSAALRSTTSGRYR